MVKVAIAGGAGNFVRELTEALAASGKHEIVILSRKDAPSNWKWPEVGWTTTSYENKAEVERILQGVHTLLSCITPQSDEDNKVQNALIDAAVKAGVKRFAPSEWVGSKLDGMDWYWGKAEIRQYLQDINKDKKVLEYCLFQPGWLTNYFAHPHVSAEHFRSFETPIDFNNCRALLPAGSEEQRITLTTIQDVAQVIVRAIEYKGEWPVVGGIKGTEMLIADFIALGEDVRGKSFAVEKLPTSDLEAGQVKSTWMPNADHPGLPDGAEEFMLKMTASVLLNLAAGGLNVSDEWNKLLPDYRFTQTEDFLGKIWASKP